MEELPSLKEVVELQTKIDSLCFNVNSHVDELNFLVKTMMHKQPSVIPVVQKNLLFLDP